MAEDLLIRFLEKRTRSRFTALVHATRADVLNAAYRVLGDLERAEDVTQEVFLKLLTVKWDPNAIRSPRGLLISTTLLAARAAARQEARRAERERRAGGQRLALDACAAPQEASDVREAVAGLPAELSECVELRYFGGLAAGEVAEAMGWTLRTTNHRLKQARDILRARLAAPAAAIALPVLEGNAEAAWPAVEVSSELRRKLEALSSDGPAMARIAGGKAASPATGVLVTGGAGLLLLLAAAWVVRSWNAAPEVPPLAAGTGIAAPRAGAPSGPGAQRELVAAPSDSPGQPTPVETAEAPAGGARTSAPDGGAPGSGGFSIEVVDEDGALLEEGGIRLRVEPLDMSLDGLESIAPLAPLAEELEKHSLAQGNPHELRGLPPCALSAQATAPGRAPSGREPLRIEAGRVTALRLVVPRPRSMEVRVLDGASGEAIPDAKAVSISEVGRRGLAVEEALLGLETEPRSGAGRTGPDGACFLEGLGAGLHRVEVYREGYRTARLEGVDPAKGVVVRLEKATGGGSIAVTATGPRGEPVTRVSVVLGIEGESADRRQDLDAAGQARFDGIPAGTHSIALDATAWASTVLSNGWRGANSAPGNFVVVRDAEETQVALGFLKGTSRVDVIVVGGAGEARTGVRAVLSGPCLREGRTGRDGRIVFEEVPAGDWSASAGEGPGWVQDTWSLGDGQVRTLRLVLGEGVIRGRVSRRSDAAGVSGIAISASGPAGDDFAITGPDGSFRFENAAPGRYTIQASAMARQVGNAEVDVPVTGDAAEVEIRLEP